MREYILGLNEIDTVVEDVVKSFPCGVVILKGDLASGKTTFVKKIVKKLGITNEVTSPTFSLQQCYGNNIFHYDIYNHGLEHFISLGMLEELDKKGLHFIEWGDTELENILKDAGIDIMVVNIEKTSQETRKYRIDYA